MNLDNIGSENTTKTEDFLLLFDFYAFLILQEWFSMFGGLENQIKHLKCIILDHNHEAKNCITKCQNFSR